MFLNKIPDKRNNRTLLVIQERYRGKDGKPHSRTVEKIGFLEDLKDKYDDPVAHFREEARRRTAEKKAQRRTSSLSRYRRTGSCPSMSLASTT